MAFQPEKSWSSPVSTACPSKYIRNHPPPPPGRGGWVSPLSSISMEIGVSPDPSPLLPFRFLPPFQNFLIQRRRSFASRLLCGETTEKLSLSLLSWGGAILPLPHFPLFLKATGGSGRTMGSGRGCGCGCGGWNKHGEGGLCLHIVCCLPEMFYFSI